MDSPSGWDIELGSSCYSRSAAPPGKPLAWFSAGEHHRVYEVVISPELRLLVFTWGDGYGGEGDDVLDTLNPLADELVKQLATIPAQ